MTREERFWAKVDKSGGEDACWEWTASRKRRGYGEIWNGHRVERAHRFSWQLHNGPIPDGLWVLHRCDNPPCVNPKHLFLGTHDDNVADMNAKGRRAYYAFPGESNGGAKLTTEAVIRIKIALLAGEPHRSIARREGVHHSNVDLIARGKAWKHVTLNDGPDSSCVLRVTREAQP